MERQDLSDQFTTGFEKVKMPRRIAIDFDGVLTDGKHYLNENGKMFYSTHSRDNWALARLINLGFEVDIVTANDSPIIKQYAEDRKLGYVYSRDKNIKYDIVIVDSIQDTLLADRAEHVFVPQDGDRIVCNENRMPVLGGHGVINYFVQKLISQFI
jgi:3-deoxy-D-manno-octulosonate 8-phosphate phosphatase KdsC-like HAD superfamily phosphatase